MFLNHLLEKINIRYSVRSSEVKLLTICTLCVVVLLAGCTTTKKKDDLSGLGMLYQNMTAHYNGYFNATEIMKESVTTLQTEHRDNYNQLLPVFEYTAIGDPASVASELDEAIKKSSVVISLHRPSKWTDDCYLLIGQAQYLKQDYESAQKTLEYMINNFDDTGKSKAKSSSKKQSKAANKAERMKQIQAKNKEIQARKKEQAKDRAERNKEIKDQKKEREKTRKQEKKEREKAYKQRKKDRDRANKIRRKNIKNSRKKKSKSSSRKPSSSHDDKTTKPEPAKEEKKVDSPTPKTTTTKSITEKKEDEKKPFVEDEEDDKKKNKKDKDEKLNDGPLAHKPAKPRGMLWLAKTYVERDFITQADRLFKQAESSGSGDKELMEELYPSMAHFYIYTEQYDSAIPALEQAIETSRDRELRARYAFIIGQLLMMNGSQANAVEYFDLAAKWSRDYEMTFNAKLNSKLAGLGSSSPAAIAEALEKMLKDRKNEEYLDQIYFQIAKTYLEADNFTKAEEYLQLALDAASNNPTQKTEIYYALGEIYYGKDKFDLAYDNYSAALSSMSKTDGRYRGLEERKTSLVEISKHLKQVNLQDSLMMLASLSDDELKKRAEGIVRDRKMKEQKAEETAKGEAMAMKVGMPVGVGTGPLASSNSLESDRVRRGCARR